MNRPHLTLHTRHPLHDSLPIFFINVHKPKRPGGLQRSLHNLRLQHHGGKKTRLLRQRGIIADPMPATGRLEEALTSLLDGHRLVVHFVQDGAGEDVDGYGGAVMSVRRRAGSWREGDFQAQDCFVGCVEEFVFVDDFEDGEGGALGRGGLCQGLGSALTWSRVLRGRSNTLRRKPVLPCLRPRRRPCSNIDGRESWRFFFGSNKQVIDLLGFVVHLLMQLDCC
jgi:hypothetical protein